MKEFFLRVRRVREVLLASGAVAGGVGWFGVRVGDAMRPRDCGPRDLRVSGWDRLRGDADLSYCSERALFRLGNLRPRAGLGSRVPDPIASFLDECLSPYTLARASRVLC